MKLAKIRPMQLDHQETCNLIFQFFAEQQAVLQNWGFYLFNEQFKGELELRNKLGSIWICSLYDTLDGEERVLPELLNSSEKSASPILVHYCGQISELAKATRRFLASLSRPQQLFLQDFRNQLVHAWQINPRQARVSIKYVSGNRLIREQVDREAYHLEIRPFYEEGIDQSLAAIV